MGYALAPRPGGECVEHLLWDVGERWGILSVVFVLHQQAQQEQQ
jgi:hypothetical protein